MKKLNSLEIVLDFENKGAILYMNLAKKTENILGKKLFYSLALQEVEHAEKADGIKSILASGNNSDGFLPGKAGIVEKELKEFFNKAGKTLLKKGAENLSGYELAMKMERKGYKIYSGYYGESKNKTEKEFFKQIIEQEKEHLDSISNVYSYLTKTGDWLQEDESKTWSWMNL